MKTLSAQNLFTMKHESFEFDGRWAEILGNPPTTGVWIIYGKEKHGKSSVVLSLVDYLSTFKKALYVSAEEGTDQLFIDTVRRSGITAASNIGFVPYMDIPDLNAKLKKRNAAEVVVIDNMSNYVEEFGRNRIDAFMREHSNKLLIFLSHEERKEPDTAAGRRVKKFAKIIVRVEGLIATFGGRCPGGQLTIHEEKAQLFGVILNQ